jgi:hypothetical protein
MVGHGIVGSPFDVTCEVRGGREEVEDVENCRDLKRDLFQKAPCFFPTPVGPTFGLAKIRRCRNEQHNDAAVVKMTVLRSN